MFNRLTGNHSHVGNWTGITTELESGKYIGDKELEIVDLPGIYSLNSPNAEEIVAKKYLEQNDDIIINIVDATNLTRNLFLTKELIDSGKKVIVGLNFCDVLRKRKIKLDIEKLEGKFGLKFYPVSAMKNEGIEELIKGISSAKTLKKAKFSSFDIEKTVEESLIYGGTVSRFNKKADDILCGKFTALPIFLLLMALVFFIVFGSVGHTKLLGLFLEAQTRKLLTLSVNMLKGALVETSLSGWFISLFCDGILMGITGVLSFFPQILLMFFFLSVMEDTGYMARIAFITDKLFAKIGLTGRSVLPLVMGFGCSVSAVMTAAATIEKEKKDLVISTIPYLPCGAKLPLFVILSSAFFGGAGWWLVFLMYIAGVTFAVLFCSVSAKTVYKKSGETFIMELPPYRAAAGGNVIKLLIDKLKTFVKRVGSVILIASVAVWILSYFTPSLRAAQSSDESLFAYIGKSLAFLFYPLGFGTGEKGYIPVLAVFSGFMAKEAIVSTLFVLSGGNIALLFDKFSAISFMLFNLLVCPCVSALAAMYQEMEKKSAFIRAVLIQIAIAYVFSASVYLISRTI